MVPWLFNGSTFISYDDEQSMGLKAQYIKNKGLGGAMIWELSQDPNRVLLNSLYNGLK
jgi:chitinase